MDAGGSMNAPKFYNARAAEIILYGAALDGIISPGQVSLLRKYIKEHLLAYTVEELAELDRSIKEAIKEAIHEEELL